MSRRHRQARIVVRFQLAGALEVANARFVELEVSERQHGSHVRRARVTCARRAGKATGSGQETEGSGDESPWPASWASGHEGSLPWPRSRRATLRKRHHPKSSRPCAMLREGASHFDFLMGTAGQDWRCRFFLLTSV